MPRNLQQQPTRQEFEAAALRLGGQEYPGWLETSLAGHSLLAVAVMFTFTPVPAMKSSLKQDVDTILRERDAEGLVVGEERIEDFARNLLARYANQDRKRLT